MQYVIKVFPNKQLEELETLKHFLNWQGQSYIIDENPDVLKYSQGRSLIHIIQHDADNKPMVGFNTFNQFYDWFLKSGLMQC